MKQEETRSEMQHTRRQILDCIKLNGGMSVDQLGRKLQIMSVTVRAHINVMERGNLVKGRELRTGRAGRPRIVYSLTDQAQELFPKDYDHLAVSLISNMRKLYGNDSVKEVLKLVGEEIAASNADEVQSEDSGRPDQGCDPDNEQDRVPGHVGEGRERFHGHRTQLPLSASGQRVRRHMRHGGRFPERGPVTGCDA